MTKRGWLTHIVATAARTGGTNTYLDLSFSYDATGNLLTATGSADVGGSPMGQPSPIPTPTTGWTG